MLCWDTCNSAAITTKITRPPASLPYLAFAVHHEKQDLIAFIFYYLKEIVKRHVISIILCSLSH